MKYYKIGELAKQAGIHSTTVRYYEKIGILPKPVLNGAGYRLYDDYAVRTARFIMRAKELGFSLKEISELLSHRFSENNPKKFNKDSCGCVKTMAEFKIIELDNKISSLIKLKERLIELKNKCVKNEDGDICPIISILEE